jgi:hypothetical protein
MTDQADNARNDRPVRVIVIAAICACILLAALLLSVSGA